MTKRTVTKIDRLVAENIKRLRTLYGISRRELEEKSGIAYGILDQIETFHKPAGKSIQKRLTEALGCSLTELYCEESPSSVREPAAPYLTKRQKRLLDSAEHLTDKQVEDVFDYMAWLLAKKRRAQKPGKK